MKGKPDYEFCMKQFKPAIAVLAALVVIVLGWSIWHCINKPPNTHFVLAAVTKAKKPPAKQININDKMIHPYWGNCNQCHITVGSGKPVSKVMAGAPISIKQKMTHEYWGNCLLCHKVTDGFQAPSALAKNKAPVKAAAFNQFTARTLGLKVQRVTASVMQKFALPNEDGVLILEVAPGSIAARAGLNQGDEIIRVGNVRLDTTKDFTTALQSFEPGSSVKINIYRGKKGRNLHLRLPDALPDNTVAVAAPMTQNRVETLAEQFGVPKTQQNVTQALQRQQQGQVVGYPNYGKVAVATTGPGLFYPVAAQFGASPYFIVFDPGQSAYNVVANPNANDVTGKGVQTGQYMVDLGVSNVIAGSFNQSAIHTLHTLRVNVYSGVTGMVQDMLGIYMAGQLAPTNTAAVMQPAASGPGLFPGISGQGGMAIY
jgi:predicted Fe-Mo cluster-binding NifX family protein